MSFKRNEEIVKKAEVFTAGSIRETGFYPSVITRAYDIVNAIKGSKTMRLDVVADAGNTSSIYLYYESGEGSQMDKNGNPNSGIPHIHTLMALLDISSLDEKSGKIEVYDFDTKATVEKRVTGYPQLRGKEIGIIWQMQEEIKQVKEGDLWMPSDTGELIERPVFIRFCDYATKATAGELKNGTEPSIIDAYLDKLDPVKRLKLKPAQIEKAKDAQINKKAAELDDDDFDDDIPF